MLISFKTKQGIIMKKLFLLLSIVIYSFGAKDFVSPDVAIKPSVKRSVKIGNVPFNLEIQYQGCTKLGLCYAPTSKTFEFPKIDNIK